MTDAPEQIFWNQAFNHHNHVSTEYFAGGTSYIRADLAQAMIEQAVREAVLNEREAIEQIILEKANAYRDEYSNPKSARFMYQRVGLAADTLSEVAKMIRERNGE